MVMNIKIVINFLGRILIGFSAIIFLPTIVAIYYNENPYPFIYGSITSLIVGLIFYCSTKPDSILRFKESFAIVSLSWLFIAIIGSIPYLFVGVSFIDAFFESMSGFTTTGATIFDKPEILPKSILFWRAMTQWIGGLGIIVLFVVIFPIMAKEFLFRAEYPGVTLNKLKPRIREMAIILFIIYMLFTLAEIVILYLLGVPIFDAITHSLTTLSTGGFSTHSESIGFFKEPIIEFVIAIFAIIGGTNFAIHYYLLKGKLKVDVEFKLYLTILVIATLMVTLLNLRTFDLYDAFRYSFFQVTSIMTTTGFTTYDFDEWNDNIKYILLILMLIGGCSCSTSGGLKVGRIYILVKYAIMQIFKSAEPKSVRVIKYGDTPLKKDIVDNVIAFFILYITIFIVSSFIICLSGYDILTSTSAVIACLSNVGPGMGLAGASETYSIFSSHVKLILALNMWIGRLEIYPVLALFVPSFWREKW